MHFKADGPPGVVKQHKNSKVKLKPSLEAKFVVIFACSLKKGVALIECLSNN